MTDYLHTLLARSFHPEASIGPRLGSQFERLPFDGGGSLLVEDAGAPALPPEEPQPVLRRQTPRPPLADVVSTISIREAPQVPSTPEAPVEEAALPPAPLPPSWPALQRPAPTPPMEPTRTITIRAEPPQAAALASPVRPREADPVPPPVEETVLPERSGVQVKPSLPGEAAPPRPPSLLVPGVAPPVAPRLGHPLEAPPDAGELLEREHPRPAAVLEDTVPAPQQLAWLLQPAVEAPTVRPRADDLFEGWAPEASAQTAAPTPPTIRVTIGRVEVRAQTPPRRVAPTSPPARPRPPSLSLDDYLKQRNQEQR